MILKTSGRLGVIALLATASAPASADVMEIGEDGARWVAGGPAPTPAQAEMSATYTGTVTAADGTVVQELPAVVISDPALTAIGVPLIYQAKVQELSLRFDISPSLLEALVWQESRWRPTAVSHAGARGLAQLMPATARYLGVDPDDPFQNLEGGARYLREQLDRFDGNLEKALAAYNAGPGRVIAADGVPNIRETKLYVAAIMARLSNHSRQEV